MYIFAFQFFEYIGIIDNEKECFEGYFYFPKTFKTSMQGKGDHLSICEEKILLHANPDEYDQLRQAVSLDTIRDRLEK